MPDVFSKTKRSALMAQIRGRGNKTTEMALVRLLRMHSITGWRRHASLIGRPDFAFHRERVAVFVDGCFWHGCPRCYRRPATNPEFWYSKVLRNRTRDGLVSRTLRAAGWRVLRIWEHELKRPNAVLVRIQAQLRRRPAQRS